MTNSTSAARTLWELLEPIHAVTYFSPEPLAALSEAGYRGFWMGYFAGRAAPLGAVGPEVVRALFYNFSPERVEKALPAAWSFAGPEVALEARAAGSVAALRRLCVGAVDGGLGGLAFAIDGLLELALGAPIEGRGLFAANRALPVPADPIGRLWHAATLLREHRGDGHIATLLAAGIGGRESHVLHATAIGFSPETYTTARDFTESEWAACLDSLAGKGLVESGRLTPLGVETKEGIEERTDALAAEAFASLSRDDLARIAVAMRPIAAAVVRSGDIPVHAPMGLDLGSLIGES